MKRQKLISATTAAVFLTAVVAQPLTIYAAEDGTLIEQTKQKIEDAQNNPPQNPYQQTVSPSGTIDLNRITVYDQETGNLVTVVQNSAGQVSAYDQVGQQVEVKAEWTKNLPVIPVTPTTIPQTAGGIVGTGTTETGATSKTEIQQLSTVLSSIKTDGNLNTFGKIAKALLALEAIRANNQIMQKQIAAQQQKAQEKSQQPATVTEKANTDKAKNSAPAEYVGTLRDAEETGGTRQTVAVQDVAEEQQESALPIDLIGRVASIDGNTISVQNQDGQTLDVEVEDPENYKEGDYLNASGTVLSGSDNNIYVIDSPEDGLCVSVNKIDEDAYNQKVAEQQQAAQDFAQENPDLAGYSGTGAAGSYYAPAGEDDANIASSAYSSNYTGEDDASIAAGEDNSQYADAEEESSGDAESGTDWKSSFTAGKLLSYGAIAGGAGLVAASGVVGFASYGAAAPASVLMFKAGAGLVASGVLGLAAEDVFEDIESRKIE